MDLLINHETRELQRLLLSSLGFSPCLQDELFEAVIGLPASAPVSDGRREARPVLARSAMPEDALCESEEAQPSGTARLIGTQLGHRPGKGVDHGGSSGAGDV
jgi:hypothetical protein